MLPQFFSLWVRLQLQIAIPAWTVSQSGGGHGAAVGCAQLLLASGVEHPCVFGARPQGMLGSFSLSWPECDRTIRFKLSNFGHFVTIHPLPRKGWWVGKIFSAKRQRFAKSSWWK
jgi:hypothetical protein